VGLGIDLLTEVVVNQVVDKLDKLDQLLNHLLQRMLLELEGMHLETEEGMHLGLDHKELDKELGQPDILLLGKL